MNNQTNIRHRDGLLRISEEAAVMAVERREQIIRFCTLTNRCCLEESMGKTRTYYISPQIVWDSYRQVKANKGSAGIDDITIADFERNLGSNLYSIWNRMASGSYFPLAVKREEIPKSDGGTRILGIPTITDRIAQTVVKMHLEGELEKTFHPDSYGYRPKRSAHMALATTLKRCWQHDWVIDLDIKGFFDNIPHDLMMKAVKHHTQEKWILCYIERWLTAAMQTNTGELIQRTKGTPQGGVMTPRTQKVTLNLNAK